MTRSATERLAEAQLQQMREEQQRREEFRRENQDRSDRMEREQRIRDSIPDYSGPDD